MKIVSISGKSGSGKSHVAKLISQQFDCEVLDFDKISHDTLSQSETKNFIKQNISNDVFENGKLNRKKLGEIVFKDKQKLELLNNFCQTQMEKIIDDKIKNCNNQIMILDYQLLPKMKYFDMSNFKVLVKSEKNTRFSRILKRDGISEEYFELREKNSIDFNEEDFDFVFFNNSNSNINDLIFKLKELLC